MEVNDLPQNDDSLDFSRTTEDIEEYSTDLRIISFCRNNFFRFLPTNDIKKLIRFLLIGRGPDGEVHFRKNDLTTSKKCLQFNKNKFDKDKNYRIRVDIYNEMREQLFKFIKDLLRKEENFYSGLKKDEALEDDVYWVTKEATYDKYKRLTMDEPVSIIKYDFNNNEIEINEVNSEPTLQHVYIDIVTTSVTFEYPYEYTYTCRQCGQRTKAKPYEVASNTKNGISCPGIYTYTNPDGEIKSRICKSFLYPDSELQKVRTAFFYELNYEEEGQRKGAQGISFMNLLPGRYEGALFYVPGSKIRMFHIVDVKKPLTNEINLPEKIPSENYLFTLQKCFDNYIEQKTGVRIYGLNPIKCALILQTMAGHLKERLVMNVMIVGDPSTGKSLVLKYYPFLLNHYFNLSSNGLSISIPGLRGTRSTINLFGKDIKIVTIGHLGSYRSIHIDEAGENKELVQNLKSFLLEDNYSYDKAGSVGITNKRTSHVNLSQNLDYDHVGQYRGAIRKAYKDLNMTMEGIEKEEWDESWDLFLPLHKYENPQLRKVIREKRLEFKQKQVFWLDGTDYALHERFPFYFFIVNEKPNPELDDIIALNSSRKVISENIDIIKSVYTTQIEEFFKGLKEYTYCEEDIVAYKRVRQIIKEYGFHFDARTLTIYQMLVRFSRIINQRKTYEEQDYDIVRWYLETTNIKLDIVDTNTYKIVGPPDLIKSIAQQQVEDTAKDKDDIFGLPEGEFN